MKWGILLPILFGATIIGVNWLWLLRVHKQAVHNARQQMAEEHYRFLRHLDHELKNPLTAMQIGLANLAHVEQAPTPEHIKIRESIHGQITRLNRLVSSLRKLVDLELAQIECIPLDLANLLQETCGAVGDYAESEGRQMTLNLSEEGLPTIRGDRDLLQLAIYNVLDNAIKFTRGGDTIDLAASVDEGQLVITIRDTGYGIPERDLSHVWENLYRSPSVRGIPGSGIGLSLVKTIIEKHGGRAEIESTLDTGTTVRLKLPI